MQNLRSFARLLVCIQLGIWSAGSQGADSQACQMTKPEAVEAAKLVIKEKFDTGKQFELMDCSLTTKGTWICGVRVASKTETFAGVWLIEFKGSNCEISIEKA